MTVLVELARRAVAHPQTTTFVKRAVAVHNGRPAHEKPEEIPIWGVVIVYITLFVACVAISLVSTPCPAMYLQDVA
jgi:hypothetical protein